MSLLVLLSYFSSAFPLTLLQFAALSMMNQGCVEGQIIGLLFLIKKYNPNRLSGNFLLPLR